MQTSGFSLLELLIAMIICAILALVGMMSWQEWQARSELASVTRQLLNFLNAVKADANLYNYNQAVYWIASSPQDWCLAASEHNRPINCATKWHFIPDQRGIALLGLSADTALVFYGRRSSAKAATLRLRNQAGESRIIISVPGRIRYCSYQTYLAGLPLC